MNSCNNNKTTNRRIYIALKFIKRRETKKYFKKQLVLQSIERNKFLTRKASNWHVAVWRQHTCWHAFAPSEHLDAYNVSLLSHLMNDAELRPEATNRLSKQTSDDGSIVRVSVHFKDTHPHKHTHTVTLTRAYTHTHTLIHSHTQTHI